MTETVPLIVNDLYKRFDKLEVLKGVSLQAHKGDVITLIGSSGSGKSTLLRCINMLEIPTAGEIIVHGEPVSFKTDRKGNQYPSDTRQVERMRSKLAMVFQSFNLWSHMTVLQNVIEAPIHVLKVPKKEAIERAEHYLDKVGIIDKKDHFPAQMSGGQQQRAAIARALAVEPEVMLFDEPTSALDPELVGEVLRVMHSLADEGRTMILVTHEMAFCREVSTQVLFLHQGQIEEQGTPREVFENTRSERMRQFLAPSY